MRTTALVTAALVSTSLACSVAATDGAPHDAPTAAANGAPATRGSLAPTAGGAASSVTVDATVPVGVQCVVGTLSGADSETVAATVASGASTATLGFGSLTPGVVTVTANAYGTACPGTGTPTWVSEPVQVTVVAGEITQIPITLHPVAAAVGTTTFSLNAVAIAAGLRTSYAVLSDGTVRAWGLNDEGEFGSETIGQSLTPVVVPGVTNAVQIAAGTDYACVIRTDSSVMCWGYNVGQLYTFTALDAWAPPTLCPGLYATQMSAANFNMAFLGTNGSIGVTGPSSGGNTITWSPDSAAPLYNMAVAVGATPSGTIPSLLWINQGGVTEGMGSVGAAAQVFVGTESLTASFGFVLLDNGTVEAIGSDSFGELGWIGNSTTSLIASPGLTRNNIASMALSRTNGWINAAHSCALSAGTVLCAGNNTYGQMGNDTNAVVAGFNPVLDLTNVTQIAAGAAHTCALDTDGFVHCWGYNADGELGDGTNFTRFAPVTVQPW